MMIDALATDSLTGSHRRLLGSADGQMTYVKGRLCPRQEQKR